MLFFLGLRNALFVGIAIPLSMFMAFIWLNAAGVTLNMMVLFSLVLALGMLVDNGIVIVENIYRLMDEGYSPFQLSEKPRTTTLASDNRPYRTGNDRAGYLLVTGDSVSVLHCISCTINLP